ncbi:MAG: outer membrane lipoprotein-sorting protein [Firmicutes bacterium]|nr:outer membrane lipoprotein-sorting protein [Bacillota bacterium]
MRTQGTKVRLGYDVGRLRERRVRGQARHGLGRSILDGLAGLALVLAVSVGLVAAQAFVPAAIPEAGAGGVLAAPTAQQVMERVQNFPVPKTMHGQLSMTLVSGGKGLARKMEIWQQGRDKTVIKFLEPADVRGTAFLAILSEGGGDDTMMLYLPALKAVRRVAGSQRQASFMGSDFTYDDIANLGIRVEDYTYQMLATEKGASGPIYVISATPKKPGKYTSLKLWVPEPVTLPSRVEFYQGKELLKTLSVEHMQDFGSYRLPTKMVMTDRSSGHQTIIQLSDLETDVALPAYTFTQRFLTMPL